MKHQYYHKRKLGWLSRLRAWFNLSGARMVRLAPEKLDPFRDIKSLQ